MNISLIVFATVFFCFIGSAIGYLFNKKNTKRIIEAYDPDENPSRQNPEEINFA